MKTLIHNIKQIVQATTTSEPVVKGKDMSFLPCINTGWLAVSDDTIAATGTMQDGMPSSSLFDEIIDATGKLVLPCWCDSHTHLVYAASREDEFVSRIKGMSYEEIARNGGGILNSAIKLNTTSEDELYEGALSRLNGIIKTGTGAVEIKSGYGLNVEGEMKMLRVIKKLKEISPIIIKATFLGAHAIPSRFKNDRKGYINLIKQEMLPAIAAEDLADYCDVFCDKGFFSPDETGEILEAAWKYGLPPKIHANELTESGGIEVGVKYRALSVDHLEHCGNSQIEVLLNSSTMPTLLPSTAFFLGLRYPYARKMIDAGLPVALASDFNPGTSPSGNMNFILSLASIKMKMLPEEVINAATVNAAYAMGVERQCGSITPGKKANFILTNPIPSINYIPYSYGGDFIHAVYINGKCPASSTDSANIP